MTSFVLLPSGPHGTRFTAMPTLAALIRTAALHHSPRVREQVGVRSNRSAHHDDSRALRSKSRHEPFSAIRVKAARSPSHTNS